MFYEPITTSSAKFATLNAQAATLPSNTFDITPVIHPEAGIPSDESQTFWSATANSLYIVRENGTDLFGATPDFAAKLIEFPDLCDHGWRGPIGCDDKDTARLNLWRVADTAAVRDRPSAPVAFYAIGWLPASGGHDL